MLNRCFQGIASRLISDKTPKDENGNPLNPLDSHFYSLQLNMMDPIVRSGKEFATLNAYVHDSHASTHHFQAKLQYAFRVERCVVALSKVVITLTCYAEKPRPMLG
jgi:hypothetical protein